MTDPIVIPPDALLSLIDLLAQPETIPLPSERRPDLREQLRVAFELATRLEVLAGRVEEFFAAVGLAGRPHISGAVGRLRDLATALRRWAFLHMPAGRPPDGGARASS